METAVFNTAVECPICKTDNTFETIRVGAYVENGRDADFCPADVQWRVPKYERWNPLAFFIATCPTCHYSREFNDTFKNWKADATFKTYRVKRVRDRHLEELSAPGSLIKVIGASVDMENAPNESAIAKFLLAIHDESFNERPMTVDLARWYLRIAWIYRGMNASSGAGGAEQVRLAEYASHIARCETQADAWKRDAICALENCARDLGAANGGALGSELAQIKEAMLAYHGKLLEVCCEWRDALGKISPIGAQEEFAGAPFGGRRSFVEFLMFIKNEWHDVPINEREAIALAIDHYKRGLEEGKEIAAGNQQIQVCYLIGELSRRLGLYQQAREYFNSCLKVGQEFVHQNRGDKSRTALARKILEMAMEQTQLARDESNATVKV